MAFMRAKMYITEITQYGAGGKVTAERLAMRVVANSTYGPNGESEDNTFARFSPAGELSLTITNPALIGAFTPGDAFYLDFTKTPLTANAQG